jgi:xanthine dehydrogenase accessory factor
MTEHWPARLHTMLGSGPCVLVSIVNVRGSAPRALGSRMLVAQDEFSGSIGGGRLEYQALAEAREMLGQDHKELCRISSYGLGPALEQCCGGAVTLHYERFVSPGPDWLQAFCNHPLDGAEQRLATSVDSELPSMLHTGTQSNDADSPSEPGGIGLVQTGEQQWLVEDLAQGGLDLHLFGAGHIGKAVADILETLPIRLHWYDQRVAEFPLARPVNLVQMEHGDPVAAVSQAKDQDLFLVMTHSHQLDEDICHAVLSRDNFGWLGLIGSRTKRARFVKRLADRGISEDRLERLECPVGLPGLSGKRPATIAVAIAAQLLNERVPEQWK